MTEEGIDKLALKSIAAAIAAGKEILKVYETNFHVTFKADKSPVTMADKNAGDIITSLLSETNIPVLSEEGPDFSFEKRKNLEYLWVVDPLDGTKEFVKRNGEFTVNIALLYKGTPVLGVIYSPVFKDLYFAADGFGSYKINRHALIAIIDRLHSFSFDELLSEAEQLPRVNYPDIYTIVASRSHLSSDIFKHIQQLKEKHRVINIINTGSSIKMCWVAEGLAQEYPRFGTTMEWDTAAGQSILQNAGCELIDITTGEPMRYNRSELKNNWFIARKIT